MGVYLGTALFDLRLPGLQYDEAYDAVAAIDVLHHQQPRCVRPIRLFGHDLPLMIHHHIGPTSTYLSLVGFALFGVSVEALRAMNLALGVLTLGLLLAVARAWFDDRTAGLAVLLCASAPPFVWWTRAGANWTAPLLPIALAMMLASTHWWRTGRVAALAAAAFLFGLGFTTKILFVWLTAPLVLTVLVVLGPRGACAMVRRIGAARLGTVLAALALGLAPVIVDNVPDVPLVHHLLDNAHTTRYGHDNLDVVTNLRDITIYAANLLDGDTLMYAPRGWRAGSTMLVLALVYTAALCLRRRSRLRGDAPAPGLRARLFLLLVPLTVIPASTVSTSVISSTYLFIILPFSWLLVASALAVPLARARPGRDGWRAAAGTALAAGATAALLANHVLTNAAVLHAFETSGGHGAWSDTVFALARKLETDYPDRPVVAMDWGFTRNLDLLTQSHLDVREGFEYLPTPSPGFALTCRRLLADPRNVYLVRVPEWALFKGYWASCEAIARETGVVVRLEATLRERDGRPNTLIYTARPAGLEAADALARDAAAVTAHHGALARAETGSE